MSRNGKRRSGVSAFLLDCETAYAAAEAYVVSGVKTFRSLPANEFAPSLPAIRGLVTPAGSYGSIAFDAAVAPLAPGGGTPLADALTDIHATIVTPPFGWLPADERRYVAFFTDGMLTSGSPLASIPDGSLLNTVVFAMGFGTGADVDYATLDAIVAKGESLAGTQVFHGDNAGAIDKFYSQALSAALGFTPVMDRSRSCTRANTNISSSPRRQPTMCVRDVAGHGPGDDTWSYQLIAADGEVAWTDGSLPVTRTEVVLDTAGAGRW